MGYEEAWVGGQFRECHAIALPIRFSVGFPAPQAGARKLDFRDIERRRAAHEYPHRPVDDLRRDGVQSNCGDIFRGDVRIAESEANGLRDAVTHNAGVNEARNGRQGRHLELLGHVLHK